MTTQFLADDIERDEGCELTAYQDTLGIWTVGVGHAHVAPGTVWTKAQCDAQLATDIATAEASLDTHAAWWRTMSDPRQDVLANMCFNMGWPRLSGFAHALAAMQLGDYDEAADQMLDSTWAKQVKGRATRLADQMRSGVHLGG